MTIEHHPDTATLMAFAAGTLGEALSAVVATHAGLCPACRHTLGNMDRIGAVLLAGLESAPMPAGAAQAAIERDGRPGRRSRVEMWADPLEKLIGGPLEAIRWKRLGPGVQSARLSLSKGAPGDLRLLKVAAGRAVPDHGHGGAELTLVLRGAYQDKLGRFGPGDVADLDEDVEHQPVAEPGEDCICLVASDRAIRLKGVIGRLLQPLVRM